MLEQTHRQTDTFVTILRSPAGGGVTRGFDQLLHLTTIMATAVGLHTDDVLSSIINSAPADPQHGADRVG